jgi:hypothetical protein
MIVYQYIRNGQFFATPSFEFAYHRNEQDNVVAEVTTNAKTPDYFYEETCNNCKVPQQHHVSGRISPCGCPDSAELIAETWQQQQHYWHLKAINKRIHEPIESN